MKRITAIVTALLILACTVFSACSCHIQLFPQPTPEPYVTAVPGDTKTDTPEKTEAPTDDPNETEAPGDADETEAPTHDPHIRTADDDAFDEIANEIFISAVTSDGLTYHQFIIDPSYFDIDPEDVELGWGDFSYEAHLAGIEENADLLERMNAINRDNLLPENVIAYDNIMQAIRFSDALNDYYYYDEPLTPFNGEHTMLPLMMTMYEVNSKEDLENCLYLVEDMPRYIGLLEQFEKEKAEQGLFMTEHALDQVLESLNGYISAGDDFFLVGYFEELIGSLDVGLTTAEKNDYIARSRKAIIDGILPAFKSLKTTLEGLRGSCREFAGAKDRSEAELRYFELKARSEAAVDLDCVQMGTMMRKLAEDLLERMYSIIISDRNAYDNFGAIDISSGDPKEDVQYLLELIKDMYPEIPDQQIQYVTIADAVADDFSPAAYLISAFDDPTRNVVLLNPTSDDSTLLFTMAHECFPGHLYQTQYFRNSKTIPLVQQVLAPGGYSEGWAVFSELMIAGRASKYNINSCLLEQYNSIITNILIPAYASVKVNYNGWDKDDVYKFVKDFGFNSMDYAQILYEYAVDMPTYFMNYAMGFTNTMRIYTKVNPRTDSKKLAFFEEYLSYGPCYYDILNEKFGLN